jgi:hypothetical protein
MGTKCIWVPVAHACNPSYSGGRDPGIAVQSQPMQTVWETLSQKKNKSQKSAGVVAQGDGPEFKPQYSKKKKKKKGISVFCKLIFTDKKHTSGSLRRDIQGNRGKVK